MSVAAIIVAAGSSSRMGGMDKQFIPINGVPVVIKSVLAFENTSEISEIIISTQGNLIENITNLCSEYNITKLKSVVVGGKTRQESVIKGVENVSPEVEYIAVHDGARPLISSKNIRKVIVNAEKYGGSILAVPVKDTIKVVEESGKISVTPRRETLFSAQTPQVFLKELYLDCVERLGEKVDLITDDSQIFELCGEKVYITNGNYSNIKITTPEDIKLANQLSVDV